MNIGLWDVTILLTTLLLMPARYLSTTPAALLDGETNRSTTLLGMPPGSIAPSSTNDAFTVRDIAYHWSTAHPHYISILPSRPASLLFPHHFCYGWGLSCMVVRGV